MTIAEGSKELSEPTVHTFSVSPDETPSTAVVIYVAELLDADVTDMPPLRDVVEPDALDEIFVSGDRELNVDFEYAGCSVTVVDGTLLRVSRSVGTQ